MHVCIHSIKLFITPYLSHDLYSCKLCLVVLYKITNVGLFGSYFWVEVNTSLS